GTVPGEKGSNSEETAQEPSTDAAESDRNSQIEPAALPPSENPKNKPTPKTDSKAKSHDALDGGDSSEKLQGTITLDIDPTTGLIAVDSCPVIRTKTFAIGQEPKKYCGPEYHKKSQPTPPPPNTRARVVNPPKEN